MDEQEFIEIAIKFLNYSFKDINMNYDGLTDEEKSLCSKEEFEGLKEWCNKI